MSLLALVVAFLGAMIVSSATSAAAHDTIIDAEPGEDAVLDAAPTEIVLTYSAEVLDLPAAILVTDSDGEVVVEGEPTVQGRSVVLDLPPALENGTYEVLWSVVSSDGHRTEDGYSFTVASSGPDADPQVTVPDDAPSEASTADATVGPTTPATEASPDAGADADADADAAETTTPSSGWPVAVMILIPIAILVVAVIAVFIYRRRQGNQPQSAGDAS
ncbi:copper resistance CopC family protein [Georgenia sp. Z1344]|uniref:copper resistance CopC family protein n=1 Tax=Georgenia sp. Z1344 TaxID=3416706 RepID=UPI003CE67CE6